MPSGKVHDKIAIISTIPVFITGYSLFNISMDKCIILTLCTLFSQLMFGPDLDAKSTQYKRWGLFRWIWLPYRKIFRHRSRFSHGLILGPILRCIYLLCFAFITIIGINFLLYKYFNITVALKMLYIIKKIVLKLHCFNPFILLVISGFFIGAAIHTLTDKIMSFFNNLL